MFHRQNVIIFVFTSLLHSVFLNIVCICQYFICQFSLDRNNNRIHWDFCVLIQVSVFPIQVSVALIFFLYYTKKKMTIQEKYNLKWTPWGLLRRRSTKDPLCVSYYISVSVLLYVVYVKCVSTFTFVSLSVLLCKQVSLYVYYCGAFTMWSLFWASMLSCALSNRLCVYVAFVEGYLRPNAHVFCLRRSM